MAQQPITADSKIRIAAVSSPKELNDFIHVVDAIYAGCQQYVPDLESDIRDFFRKETNAGLAFSDIYPLVAYQNGKAVGRIVGIINHRANQKWGTSVVRFSMIEFIDDVTVAKALLDAVAEWGLSQGMKTLQGPMGITDFDKEGMLVEDFHLTGTMSTIYNPPYYPSHLEALGFQKEADWVQIRVNLPDEVPARFARIAQYVQDAMKLRVIKLTNADIRKGGYGQKVFAMLNEAYAPLFGFSDLSPEQVDEYLKKYLDLIDKQLIPVVVNEKDEVVAAAITMGCMSEAMQKAKGRLWPFGWWHLLKALRWHHEPSVEMLLIGVRPDYQGLGVNALFFNDLIPIYKRYGFQWAETGPQLEDNARELAQWKTLSPEYVKRRRCYKKSILNS